MSEDAKFPPAQRVQKEPTVSRTPPSGKKFPCPQCGARLDFDPSARGLACPYCNFREDIETDNREVVERDYFKYLDKLKHASEIHGIVDHANETQCGACGATVLLEDNLVTDQCPFCHSHLEGEPHPVEGLIEPESLLPFQVDLRGARDAYSRWLENLWFAPSELKDIANLGQLTGVYIPYWTYDMMTYTRYQGERGDDYIDYIVQTDSKGNTRTIPVTRIAWSSVSGEVQHFFDDVLVCGSKSLPTRLITGLEPWHLGRLTPFQAHYLSGFKTERYAVGLPEGLKEAKRLIDPIIHRLVCEDIGGDHQKVHDRRTKYSAVTFKHTLLPVWIAVYRYRDQVFQILVNGSTGKVVGRRPWSTWKIARLVLAILLLILLIALASGAFSKQGKIQLSRPVRAGHAIFERSIPSQAAEEKMHKSTRIVAAGSRQKPAGSPCDWPATPQPLGPSRA